jgi:tRNA A-37 threonylcarbamoyl transferase component Bud32
VTLESEPDRLIGIVLGARYRIEARLGHGAMGTVYRARHVQMGRAFAVKVLHPRLLGDARVRRRFAREAALAGSLHHANVAGVVDVGEMADGRRYLVMEHADGETLLDVMVRDAPLPPARFLPLVQQLCSGLAHAHDLGLIHRDLKPENVIVERDAGGSERPRIVDFGVAIVREDASSSDADRLTSVGLVIGTPQYMAPEHATGAPIDHRIDLFALGVMCFELLTGVPPYDGSGVDLARANLTQDTPTMTARAPDVPVDPLLEAFTRRLMMKSRDERPATAKAARELLELIARDRVAAAAALGVELAGAAPVRASSPPRPGFHLMVTSSGGWTAPAIAPAAPPPLGWAATSPGSWVTPPAMVSAPLPPGGWAASSPGAWAAAAPIGSTPTPPVGWVAAPAVGSSVSPAMTWPPRAGSVDGSAVPSVLAHEPTARIAPLHARRTGYVIAAAAALAVLAILAVAVVHHASLPETAKPAAMPR